MQAPTHILAGIIIQQSVRRSPLPRAAALSLTAAAAFLSHGILDKLANMTYHPPRADFHSRFWVAFHLCVLATTILFFCLWWRRFKWGILFAVLPDFDWVLIHGQAIFHFQIPFYRTPHMHNLLHVIVDQTPPMSWITIPNHRQNPWACLWEVALVFLMLAAIRRLSRPSQPLPPAPTPAPNPNPNPNPSPPSSTQTELQE